jgi:hypothetical protein
MRECTGPAIDLPEFQTIAILEAEKLEPDGGHYGRSRQAMDTDIQVPVVSLLPKFFHCHAFVHIMLQIKARLAIWRLTSSLSGVNFAAQPRCQIAFRLKDATLCQQMARADKVDVMGSKGAALPRVALCRVPGHGPSTLVAIVY